MVNGIISPLFNQLIESTKRSFLGRESIFGFYHKIYVLNLADDLTFNYTAIYSNLLCNPFQPVYITLHSYHLLTAFGF